jgi:hypothetical protein
LLALLVQSHLAQAAEPPATAAAQPVALLVGQDAASGELAGWKAFSEDPQARPGDVWKLAADGVLACRGTPKGYLATVKSYGDFTLRLKWRWPAGKPGKGGVLIRMTGPDKIWPKSLEPQLNAGEAGDFWGLDGFALAGPAERLKTIDKSPFGKLTNLRKLKDLEKPAGEWNQYEIVAAGGTVSLRVNGELVNQATDCETAAGKICLTAEGSEIHFRDIALLPGDK